MEYILQKLRDKNLKVTPQRVAILEFLNKKTHPTIDDIYEEIKRDFISISLATIYKNLNTLKEEEIVFEVNTQNGKIKYDINLKEHIHSYCPNCGKLEDVFLDDLLNDYKSKLSNSIGREIIKSDILVTVKCGECA